jgi:hypothetical protein
MPSLFEASAGGDRPPKGKRWGIFFGGLLVLGVMALGLLANWEFAGYALTGFSWVRTKGTVVEVDAIVASAPTIQFSTSDGATHSFQEDYSSICGGYRSFCTVRNFAPGEVVPVVYNPRAPQTAFVHDWALFVTVAKMFFWAGMGLLLVLIMAADLMKRPIRGSIRPDGGTDS